MQSLFNKRHTGPSAVSSIFSQPPTSIIQSPAAQQPQRLPSVQPLEDQGEHLHETEEQKQEKLSRTIFIGNVKLDTNKKELKKLLQPCGRVEKIWYRSVPVEHSKMGPKASFILKKFQDNADSMNAYARFEQAESVNRALELNGKIFNGLTLRVSAADDKQLDFEKTIFIGNLPYDAKEEELRNLFSKAGTISNVRICRNRHTHQGIGIAYVAFGSQEQMRNAIKQFNGTQFKERKLRIKKAVEKKRLEKKKRKHLDPKQVNRNAALKRIQQKKGRGMEGEQSSTKPQSLPQSNPSLKRKQKTPIAQKKKPRVVQESTEQDKQLRNQVSQQLKVLRRKMIHKNK